MSPLAETLGLGERTFVTIVGGGGKTSLLFALAREGAALGKRVVTTTTTKMLRPAVDASRCLFLEGAEDIGTVVGAALDESTHVTIGSGRAGDKLLAAPPADLDRLHDEAVADWILVEGDGARHRHLKMPRDGEPVVPEATERIIAVAGVDVIGKTFTEETIFRPEIVEARTRYRRGETITATMVYDLLFHEAGILRVGPTGATRCAFLSFVDGPDDLDEARAIAERAARERPFAIDRVLLGNADPGRVKDVVRL